jgi:hypothetical protein
MESIWEGKVKACSVSLPPNLFGRTEEIHETLSVGLQATISTSNLRITNE